MSARHLIQDPARIALRAIFEETLAKGRFPQKSSFIKRNPKLKQVVVRLAADRRYLAESRYNTAKGRKYVRLAVTVPGLYEVENELGQHEQAQLAILLNHIKSWNLDYGPPSEFADIGSIQDYYEIECDSVSFARWLTMLSSPRLLNPQGHDPLGFYGQSAAWCNPDPNTGFVHQACFWPHFTSLELPQRGSRQVLLLPDNTLRYESDTTGLTLYKGLNRVGAIKPGLGAEVFMQLFDRPRREFRTLDLQAAAAGLADLGTTDDSDSLTNRYLDRWGIDRRRATRLGYRQRLDPLCRRLELFKNMPDTQSPPKWAADPQASYRKLEDDIRAQLFGGTIPADFPPIKNATRVVRRALNDALAPKCFEDIRSCFSIGETAVYRPKKTKR